MKKTLFAIASLAMLAMGCTKEQQPSETPAEKNPVSVIRISMAPTKVSVNEATGACAWQENDQIAIWFASADASTGQRVVYTYDGLYEDGSAKFVTTETITEGYTPAKVTYPAECLKSNGSWGLVRDWEYKVGYIPMYARTENVTVNEDGTLAARLNHNASVFKFTLHDIPAYAAGFVVEFSGDVKITTTFPYKTGYDEDIVLHSIAAQGRTPIQFYLIDGDETVIEGSEKKFKSETAVVPTDAFIDMGTVDFKKAELRKDYVKVCGVKWAKGNLQCVQNEGDDAFQNGWRIAPAQWHNLQYKEASTISDGAAIAYGYSNSGTAFEHFNYGGIARQARYVSSGNFFVEPVSANLDIAGKMYADVNGNTEVTGEAAFEEIDTFSPTTNHNKLWGDVSYWASKGKFRLPKNTELLNLHNVSDKLPGYYKTSDGAIVYGYLYRTPNPTRTSSTVDQEFTDADLESGLFLPKAGRRGATAEKSGTIINVMTQGLYRSSTYVGTVVYSGTTYYCSAYYSLGDGGKLADDNLQEEVSSVMNVAYTNSHAAGHLIRPVLAE